MAFVAAAAIMAGGAIAGSVIGRQKAPKQATYTPVDPQAVQKKTIEGNLANMAGAQQVAGQTNSFNQSQATSLMEQAMPGFGAMQQRMMSSVNDDLNNQNSMPQDMQDRISRFAAEKGVTRGTSGSSGGAAGSGFNGFNLVKDFGFNLTDWKNASRARALNTMSNVFGMAPRVNPMSPMSMMMDTNSALNVQGQNNQMQYNSQQAGYNASAAASNYNNMLLAGAVTNVASAAAMPSMMKGFQGMGLFGKPNLGSSGGGGGGASYGNGPDGPQT